MVGRSPAVYGLGAADAVREVGVGDGLIRSVPVCGTLVCGAMVCTGSHVRIGAGLYGGQVAGLVPCKACAHVAYRVPRAVIGDIVGNISYSVGGQLILPYVGIAVGAYNASCCLSGFAAAYFLRRNVSTGIIGVFIDSRSAVSIGLLRLGNLAVVVINVSAYFTVSVGDGADVAPVVVGIVVGGNCCSAASELVGVGGHECRGGVPCRSAVRQVGSLVGL